VIDANFVNQFVDGGALNQGEFGFAEVVNVLETCLVVNELALNWGCERPICNRCFSSPNIAKVERERGRRCNPIDLCINNLKINQ